MLGAMICAICLYLARAGQEAREAGTVVAGYAACEPHFDLAELVGSVDPRIGTLGLSVLDGDAARDCGQCGRSLGSDLGAVSDDSRATPLCITCTVG